MNVSHFLLVLASLAPLAAAQAASRSPVTVDGDGDALVVTGHDHVLRAAPDHVTFATLPGERVAVPVAVTLRFVDARRGGVAVATTAPRRTHEVGAVAYDRGDVVERYVQRDNGVEQTFTFAARPAGEGDLVVRCAVTAPVPGVATADGGVGFAAGEHGVHVGTVTGVAADGARCAGTLRLAGGGSELELVLPGAFVETAALPLVVDPLLSTATLPGGAGTAQVDAAYDAFHDRWLLVWREVVGGFASKVMGRFALLNGTTVSYSTAFAIEDTAGADVQAPRVALCGVHHVFVVVWQHHTSFFTTQNTLRARAVPANGGQIGPMLGVVTLGGDAVQLAASFGNDNRVQMVYRDTAGIVQSKPIPVNAPNLLAAPPAPASVSLAGTPTQFQRPAIGKTGGTGGAGSWLVVWEDHVGGVVQLRYTFLGVNGVPSGAPLTLSIGAPGTGEQRPAVAGDGTSFVVTADQFDGLAVSLGRFTRSGNALVATGAPTVLASAQTTSLRNGDVVSLGGRFCAAYQHETNVLESTVVARVVAPGGELVGPELPLDAAALVGYSRHAAPRLASRADAGAASDFALAVFEEAQGTLPFDRQVVAQLLEGAGEGGPVQTMAASCGLGGSASTAGACALGNTQFGFVLNGADPASSLALLSLAFPTTPVPCGPCSLLPPLVLESHPVTNGLASRALPIPIDNGLLGAQLQAQWLPLFGTTAPCATFPFLAASSIVQAEIGL